IRTLVSLPLLKPDAFAHGILREHGMRGSLLFGPPGTGKTHVVRALAREAGAHMLLLKPSDVLHCYVGKSEKIVKSIFSLARRLTPCIVFIDELDALFSQRSGDRERNGHRSMLTEFMQEMDGLLGKNENVVVIGATNRPFDLDDALIRRLPLRLLVDLPGEKEREEILKILSRSETLGQDVDLAKIARETSKFSGSDLKHLVVGAVLESVKESVTLPWKTDTPAAPALQAPSGIVEISSEEQAASALRVVHAHHFALAKRDIHPSATEDMTSHSKLREWDRKFASG
ncbi:P-loop containing nucleoside triphosphate hydrolase protein, partial [Vararia minispora EC-137]